MGNTNSRDSCRSDQQTCAEICVRTNSNPELGSSSILDAFSAANCVRTTCQERYDICRANKSISATGGVASGDQVDATSLGSESEAIRQSAIAGKSHEITFAQLSSIVKAPTGYADHMMINLDHWHPIQHGRTYYPSGAQSRFYYMGLHNSLPYWLNQNGVCLWAMTNGVYQLGTDLNKADLHVEKHGSFHAWNGNSRENWHCRCCGAWFAAKSVSWHE